MLKNNNTVNKSNVLHQLVYGLVNAREIFTSIQKRPSLFNSAF